MQSARKKRRLHQRQNRRLLARRVLKVRALLATLPRGSQDQFLLFPKASLAGLTPVRALRRGLVASVTTAARGYLER
jgi:hypothetical protein